MTKPNIRMNPIISPLFVQKYESYLPTAFDDGLSMLQKMNKIIEYMNQIGVLVNGAFEQWNEIMEWVLNDGLKESVVETLNQWIIDGTLEHIINVELLGSRASITVDTESPINPDRTSYWFKDMGNAPNMDWDGILLVDESQVIYREDK